MKPRGICLFLVMAILCLVLAGCRANTPEMKLEDGDVPMFSDELYLDEIDSGG